MNNKINKHIETCRQTGRREKKMSYSCTVMPYYIRFFFKTALHVPKQFISVSVTRQTTASDYGHYMLQPHLHFHLNT
jgi:hypothetical protein